MTRYRTVRKHLARAVESCQDTREPLAAAVAARTLPALAAAVEREMVRRARDKGASWTEVGEALGITRQSAHERFTEAARETAEAEAVAVVVPARPREPKVTLTALECEALSATLIAAGHAPEAEALRGRLLLAQAKAAGV